MFYLPMRPGSPKFADGTFGTFGLGFMTPFRPGRRCYCSSYNFPPMQTRSRVLGGSKDRSAWAETHAKAGYMLSLLQKAFVPSCGYMWGRLWALLSSVVTDQTASKPWLWECLLLSAWLRRWEVSSALPGPQRSGLRAIWEVLPVLVWERPRQLPPSRWPEPKVTGVSGLRECPFLDTVNTACPLGVIRVSSGVSTSETSLHSEQCSPALCSPSASRATDLMMLHPKEMKTLNQPIAQDPLGYVRREN